VIFAAVLFLMLACLVAVGWIGWQMMPLCPSEDGFAGHDLRENSLRPAGRYEGEMLAVASAAASVGSVNE